MRIAVCVKQVPDTGDLKIDPRTNTLVREGVEAIFNPLDEFPLEAALQLAAETAGEVVVFTMGPPAAAEALNKALAMGATQAFLLCDRAFAGADTWATSLTLARAIDKQGPFDLVLCGKQAIDGDTAQVGPGIAAHLRIPQATYVTHIEGFDDEGGVLIERLLDDQIARLRIELPAVLTVLKEANQPRLPTLAGRLAAFHHPPATLTAADLELAHDTVGLTGSPTRVVAISTPPLTRKQRRLEGDPEAVAEKLADVFSGVAPPRSEGE